LFGRRYGEPTHQPTEAKRLSRRQPVNSSGSESSVKRSMARSMKGAGRRDPAYAARNERTAVARNNVN